MTIHNYPVFVLLQVFILCLIAIAIAVPIYRGVRASSPELGWNFHGNVPTSHFVPLDYLGVFLASGIFILNLFYLPFADPDTVKAAQDAPQEINKYAMSILTLILQCVPAAIALFFLGLRFNLLEIFGLKRPDWKRIGVVVGIGMVAIYFFIFVSSVATQPLLEKTFGERENQDAVKLLLEAKASGPAMLIFVIFLACVVAPVVEEIVFRGYLYPLLKRHSCRMFAAIISGIIFSVVHGSIWAAVPLAVIGILLAIIYEESGSLWAPIIAHATFNTVSTVAMVFFYDPNNLPY